MPPAWDEENEEEDDANEEQNEFKTQNDHILILIDTRQNMQEANRNGETYMHIALKITLYLMKRKIVQNDRNQIGITFFGTAKKTPNMELAQDHIYEFASLDHPSASRIRSVQALLEGNFDFEKNIGSMRIDEPCPLKAAFWSCSQAFQKLSQGQQNDYKRIWLFTNDPNPLKNNIDEQKRTIQVIRDAFETGVELVLWPLKRNNETFDASIFYHQVIPVEDDFFQNPKFAKSLTFMESEGIENYEELIPFVRKKEFKKRALCSFPLTISQLQIIDNVQLPQIQLGVQLYKLISSTAKPFPINLDSKTNMPVKCTTKFQCVSTNHYLDEFQMKNYIEVGGDRVYMTKDEMKTIKNFGEPGLLLIGFKSLSTFEKQDYNLTTPYFVVPDEGAFEGSTATFIALFNSMSRFQKMAIVRCARTTASSPFFGALIPQEEEVDENGIQFKPPGFLLIEFPFANDIRHVVLDTPHAIADDHQIQSAQQLVRLLRVEYAPQNFENPALQKHYAVLQALALDENEVDWKEETDDQTKPDSEIMQKNSVKSKINDFSESVGGLPIASEESVKPKPTKRKLGDEEKSSGETTKKRIKKEEGDDDNDCEQNYDWKDLANSGKLTRFTVPELKAFLKSKKLPVAGKKAELIQRIEKFFN